MNAKFHWHYISVWSIATKYFKQSHLHHDKVGVNILRGNGLNLFKGPGKIVSVNNNV